MKPLIWIIDEEWPDYDVEQALLSKAYPGCTICYSKHDYQKDLIEFGYRADVILVQVYAYLPKETIDKLDNCKGIAVYGGGYDRVDIEAAKAKGIMVANVQGYCAEDIADYVVAAVFQYNKRLDQFRRNVGNGSWGAAAVDRPIKRLSSSLLMLVGCGQIGRTVAEKAGQLGMHVIGYDPYASAAQLAASGIEKVDLAEGLARADYVSLHARYIPGAPALLTMEQFKLMKRDAVLINTARGQLVAEQDLMEAVHQGIILGAVLDVICNEPPSGSEAILHCDNIVVTPHISYISEQSHHELKRRAVDNALQMLSGNKPQDLVNS